MFRLATATLGRSAASSSRSALAAARPSLVNQSRALLPSIATQSRGYHEKVIEHYENPRNVSIPYLSGVLPLDSVRSAIALCFLGAMGRDEAIMRDK